MSREEGCALNTIKFGYHIWWTENCVGRATMTWVTPVKVQQRVTSESHQIFFLLSVLVLTGKSTYKLRTKNPKTVNDKKIVLFSI